MVSGSLITNPLASPKSQFTPIPPMYFPSGETAFANEKSIPKSSYPKPATKSFKFVNPSSLVQMKEDPCKIPPSKGLNENPTATVPSSEIAGKLVKKSSGYSSSAFEL